MTQVSLYGIARKFEDFTAIKNITFEMPDGQFWVLVGPSGCGKSTILRMIAGLESATDGNLYIGDVLVNGVPARARDVAMVFQNYALYPHMTVAENLSLKFTRIGSVLECASTFRLAHLCGRSPKCSTRPQQVICI